MMAFEGSMDKLAAGAVVCELRDELVNERERVNRLKVCLRNEIMKNRAKDAVLEHICTGRVMWMSGCKRKPLLSAIEERAFASAYGTQCSGVNLDFMRMMVPTLLRHRFLKCSLSSVACQDDIDKLAVRDVSANDFLNMSSEQREILTTTLNIKCSAETIAETLQGLRGQFTEGMLNDLHCIDPNNVPEQLLDDETRQKDFWILPKHVQQMPTPTQLLKLGVSIDKHLSMLGPCNYRPPLSLSRRRFKRHKM